MLDEVQYYIFGDGIVGSDSYQVDSVIRTQNHGPHVLKKGMKKCVIFAGNSADEAFPMLQIGRKKINLKIQKKFSKLILKILTKNWKFNFLK